MDNKFVDIIAGARPNFMKIAPIIRALEQKNISYRLIHTGQHYDKKMSDTFFEELNIPLPDINLNVGSGTQAEQTAKIMVAYEKLLLEKPCELTIVVGDVTSTMACSIAAKKLNIKVAHVEAGIRSFDLSMPEEINRMVTDSITDYFFTTSDFANKNLKKSGVSSNKIFFVGNTMIDTLLSNIERLKKPELWDLNNLEEKNYIVITLHRPANVDNPLKLKQMLDDILASSQNAKVIFPIHPRTAKIFAQINYENSRLLLAEPMSYLEFNYLVKNAKCVITDSGGITEETTVMNVPCLTLRNSTERPETCKYGTNILIGDSSKKLKQSVKMIFHNKWKKGTIPPLWDGRTAERISDIIFNIFN